ncbi:hypothetical protein BN946_scf184909.g66 [Trametes cinnabarina]|uniref:AB hydrolase-1 domain-containing protein n=1 Tax=Pycnoporus cinnabarinus TaxID=5643 RepID=A0A060SAD1_PYCCI|nr:hypothetical protein BN946_scf184909.g66 [Trametes cinnabarina]
MSTAMAESYETSTFIRKYPSTQVDEPLFFVAKRYTPPSPSSTGLTLLFFHCTGSHKEVWEPIIQSIFAKARGTHSSALAIREAWTWDWQTHGEAGRLNAAVIARTEKHIIAWELAYGIKKFAATEAVFKGHTLVGISHSSGGATLLHTTIDGADSGLQYKTLIIMETSMLTRESVTHELDEQMLTLRNMIVRRKNSWITREEAKRYFQARLPWKKWDPRSLDLLVEHGLMEQTVQNPDGTTTTQVTLCCSPFQEGAAYHGHGEIHYSGAERLATLDPELPIHLIYVTPAETMPELLRNSVLQLREYASVQFLPNVGHLLIQENPDLVSTLICDILAGQSTAQAKL